VILADTSAWIEYLRATGSPHNHRLRALVGADDALATTGPVVMELLAGASDRAALRRLLRRFGSLPIDEPADWDAAAEIYSACRRGGETVRSHVDCLIAAVAIRKGVPLLHRDADFDVIARHAPLRIDAP
jgi:predicted nucleic acid-binding protein